MHNRLAYILKQAGLNGSETKMVEKLVMQKEAVPLRDMIAECKMTEFTGYRTARRLQEKGLVEILKRGALRFIRMLSLDVLARNVGFEARRLRRLELNIEALAKEIKTPLGEDNALPIQVFEGRERFIDLYDSTAERGKDELLSFGSMGNLWRMIGADYFSPFEQNFIKRRMRRGVRAYVIDAQHSTFEILMEKAHRELRDVRLVRQALEPEQYTIIVGGEAYIFDTHEMAPRVSVVRQPHLVRALRCYHGVLWRSDGK